MYTLINFLTDNFNLLEGESRTYISLLKLQPSTVLKISRATGLNRITVHGYINNLIEKGLVSQTIIGSKRLLVAESPNKLKDLLEEKRRKLEKVKHKLPEIIKSICDLIPKKENYDKVNIKFYEGKKEVSVLYEEALKADEFRAFVNIKQLRKVFPVNENKFFEAHKKNKKMQIWEIMEESKESKHYVDIMPKNRFYYKYVPPKLDFNVIDYMMFDNKVAIVDLKRSTNGILIYNKSYYNNAKAIFEFVWQVLP